ncbi:MAG: DegT/DnrJ/EryC1/StrS family aminotransferase [Clostridiales bacterium]|nr:DegT/DnrJ/EryC1/StrS family aminotransferase [Eubacteriales bacterium]MDH7566164.1 DegT/DnrJ/EryC1/StrS family aminotransferase [Clostridiales bacterium]
MDISLLNLKEQYKKIKEEIEIKIIEVMASAQYIMGPEVRAFESEMARYLGCRYAISCANGTDALVLALSALGIGQGDEVITTPFTFFATAEAISRVGALPVFVDVLEGTYSMNPEKMEEKITKRTKAVLPVHLFGQPAEMDSIMAVAEKYNLLVIEDACQAIGASYKGRKAGTIGDVGCFSFFPTKNLGAFGDGGMVVTNNEKTAKIVRALRVHGSGSAGKEAFDAINGIEAGAVESHGVNETVYNPEKYYNYLIGYNSRLDEMQAAVLRVKLKYLDNWNEKRKEKALLYNRKLEKSSLITPGVNADTESVYHLYTVQSEKRDEITAFLREKGVATGIYYPVPLHLQKVYMNLGYRKGDLPVAEYLSGRTFALPLYPELTEEEQNYIVSCIYEFERRG